MMDMFLKKIERSKKYEWHSAFSLMSVRDCGRVPMLNLQPQIDIEENKLVFLFEAQSIQLLLLDP